ncbi:unnamed protein product [Rotaria socialis]|uniref:Uncharacterized protein n=3 Tax=Rotaria socialis TaxID=392032 RepID=A0A820WCC5_9BILA|nr:unnamed protein product [Rotaria socialis]CAF4702519.1 unnamed protein product [Rotaria socialis]
MQLHPHPHPHSQVKLLVLQKFTLYLIFSIIVAYIIVGVLWFDKCIIQLLISTYLIVTGVVGIIAITADVKLAVKSDLIIGKLGVTAGNVLVGISLIVIVIFMIGWFIPGCIWVFGAFGEAQYDQPDKSDYCYRTLYSFGCFAILSPLIDCCMACCRKCFVAGLLLTTKKKDGAIPVSTTEP